MFNIFQLLLTQIFKGQYLSVPILLVDLDLYTNRYITDRPVIESKEFYKLFPKLKKRLDQQPMTHHTAGEFLDTMKTLMAKLKVSDIFSSHAYTLSDTRVRQMIGALFLVG